MANYVYSKIWISNLDNNVQLEELFSILDERGLCEYYLPKPKNITSDIEWESDNWYVVGGDYNREIDFLSNYITFESRWGPINPLILQRLGQDLGDFTYEWEEEQGYGEEYKYSNGELILTEAWDSPEWDEEELDDGEILYRLVYKWRDAPSGYYSEPCADLDYFYSEYFGEAVEMYNNN